MKRACKALLALIAAAVLLSSATALAAYSDVPPGSPYEQAVGNLTAYGVLSGNPGGAFSPEGPLTRAEFAKIAVLVAGLEEGSVGQIFTDVPQGHWAGGYIATAARNGLLIGYPDGTFKPEEKISLAQAVTVVLRLMGYDADAGYLWPDGYLLRAKELGLTEGVPQDAQAPITRGNAALILDRALQTPMRKTSQYGQDRLLIERMGFTLSEKTVLIASKKEDASLAENEIRVEAGTYVALADLEGVVSRKGRLVLNEDDEVVHFMLDEQEFTDCVVSRTYKDSISFRNGDSVPVRDETVVYLNGEKTSYSEAREDLTGGTKVTVYRTLGGGVDYLYARR